MNAGRRWAEGLRALAIPEAILATAPEPRRGPDPAVFRRRTEAALRAPLSPSHRRALDALPPEGGSVLDVGVGAGAASLPLASRASLIVGVDGSEAMLSEFRRCAEQTSVRAQAVLGTWPAVAPGVEPADVVVCHHVLYQVPDLGPFVQALSAHARRRVVVEITGRHPQAWMSDLWLRFHGIVRPESPVADDAVAALEELGVPLEREDHILEALGTGFEHQLDAIREVRRRLCLPPERDGEVEKALGDRLVQREGLWSSFPQVQEVVTLWWDRSMPAPTGTCGG